MNSERKAFEEECKLLKCNGDITRSKIGNFYIDNRTNWMWQMWLSSKNRQGYKLVPVEPTEKMQKHGNRLALADKGYRYDCASIYEAMIGAVDE